MRASSVLATLGFLGALAVGALCVDQARATLITPGNVVVTRSLGTTGNATAVVIDEYLPATAAQASAVQTIVLPSANGGGGTIPNAVNIAASGVEGMITLSSDGKYLTMGGYATAVGTATPGTAAAATVPRSVAVIDITTAVPGINTTTAMTNAHDTSNIRSAVTTNGTDIWTGGGGTNGGAVYTTLGSSSGTRVNTGAGTGSTRRVVNIFNGQLYVSGASTGGPNFAVTTVGTGTPMVIGATETTLPGMPTAATHSTYDFWFKDANTIYLADDGNAAAGGGIQKWTFNGTTWALQYTLLNNGTATTGTRGLAGTVDSNGNAVLFATTSSGSPNSTLITLTDTGASALATILATAPTGNLFKGVEFIPLAAVPEFSSFAMVGLVGLGALVVRRQRRGQRA